MPTKKSMLVLNVLFLVLLAGHSKAAGLEKIQFLKVSAQDHKAVMKNAEGKLELVGVGDVVDGATISEIVEGRIVLERPGEEGAETIIVRLKGNHQRIELIRSRGEKPSVMTAPEDVGDAWETGSLGYR